MFKNTNDHMTTKFSNAYIAHAVKTGGWREMFDHAHRAAENMKAAIDILPDDGYIGCLFTADSMKKDSMIVFASENVKMEAQDMQCVLGEGACVQASEEEIEIKTAVDTFFEEGRRIYSIDTEKSEFQDSTGTEQMNAFANMQTEMEEAGAMLRMLFARGDTGTERRASVLISLPDEMTFRMRFTLNTAWPETKIREIRIGEEPMKGEYLPVEIAGCGLRGMIFGLLKTFGDKDPRDNEDIDVLCLSVRSYNVLRRSGINTLGQVRAMSTEKLLSLRYMSKKYAEEVQNAIEKYYKDPEQ